MLKAVRFLKDPEYLLCEAARLCALLIVIEKGYADVCFMPHQQEREGFHLALLMALRCALIINKGATL